MKTYCLFECYETHIFQKFKNMKMYVENAYDSWAI